MIKIKCLLFFMFIVSNLYSQNCPDGSGSWSQDNIDYTFPRYGPCGSVDYEYRNANGEIQLKVDWSTLIDHNSWGESLLKKILLREIIDRLVTGPEGTYSVAFYYETECTATVTAYVKAAKTFTPYCCDEGATLSNEIFDGGHQYFLRKVTKSVQCGVKCCKKVFEVERDFIYDNIRQTWKWINIFDFTSPDIISVSPCQDPGLNDCYTGEPIPCNGNCD